MKVKIESASTSSVLSVESFLDLRSFMPVFNLFGTNRLRLEDNEIFFLGLKKEKISIS